MNSQSKKYLYTKCAFTYIIKNNFIIGFFYLFDFLSILSFISDKSAFGKSHKCTDFSFVSAVYISSAVNDAIGAINLHKKLQQNIYRKRQLHILFQYI